jgi:hypothetical protein
MRVRRPLLGLWLLSGACITPSLPVPPPEPAFLSFAVDAVNGQARFHADALPDWSGAKVSVFDESTGHGVIVVANPDGSVSETPPFAAHDGDRVTVVYEIHDQSAGRCLILHDGRARSDYLCPQ